MEEGRKKGEFRGEKGVLEGKDKWRERNLGKKGGKKW